MPSGSVVSADEIVDRYQSRIDPKYRSLIRHRRVLSHDRSRCIFMIVAALYRAGATLPEIAAVVGRNPYFQSKHGDDKDVLQKEISRITAKLDRE